MSAVVPDDLGLAPVLPDARGVRARMHDLVSDPRVDKAALPRHTGNQRQWRQHPPDGLCKGQHAPARVVVSEAGVVSEHLNQVDHGDAENRAGEAVIQAGKNIVDISFFAEDAFLLDDLAKRRGVTAVVDCGVAPGMSNMILGYWAERLQVVSFECLVGGLPFVRKYPFEYKTPFSPSDVLEE